MKSVLYAALFYTLSFVSIFIIFFLKRIILQKTLRKISKIISNLMFFNYIIRFSLEAYLTLIFSSCLTLINYFESKNQRRSLSSEEAFSYYGSYIFITFSFLSFLATVFIFIIKKTPSWLPIWMSELFDGLNEHRIIAVIV